MTRYEMLEALTHMGEDSEYHDGLDGWFGWRVDFVDGDTVLTVDFHDALTDERYFYEWVLNSKGART